ncbi:MAG: hypothetical protein DMF87_14510 [Acidobacteria bacterium]|nr:MAG: hypothetical protein DMF87_14510 [Acidobacteriota bacterium]
MRLSPSLQREFDQFVLLSRDSVRSLLNAALLSRDSDPSQFALWSLVLIATPPAMYAFHQLIDYSARHFQKAAIIEHAIQVDRMFFLLYGMLVAALVAAATWEALLPEWPRPRIAHSGSCRSSSSPTSSPRWAPASSCSCCCSSSARCSRSASARTPPSASPRCCSW